jgi:hypothetical protein
VIGLVGQISLNQLVSLGGFIGQISLINLSASSKYWPIGFIGIICFGLIGLLGLIGLSDLSNLSITSLVVSSALSTCQLIGLIGFVIAAKTISRRLKQAAALGVAAAAAFIVLI